MNICIYVYIYTHIEVSADTYICMCIYMYIYIYIYRFISLSLCIYIYTCMTVTSFSLDGLNIQENPSLQVHFDADSLMLQASGCARSAISTRRLRAAWVCNKQDFMGLIPRDFLYFFKEAGGLI